MYKQVGTGLNQSGTDTSREIENENEMMVIVIILTHICTHTPT